MASGKPQPGKPQAGHDPKYPPPNLTQVLPTDEPFAARTTSFGDFWPHAYINAIPISGPLAGLANGVTSRFFQGLVGDGFSPAGDTRYAACPHPAAAGAGDLDLCSFLYAPLETSATVKVRVYCQSIVVGTTPPPDRRYWTGGWLVSARCAGGGISTITSGGRSWNVINPTGFTGYYFGAIQEHESAGSGEAAYVLLKFAGGAMNILGEQRFNPAGASHNYFQEINPFTNHSFEMECTDSGANVNLVCKMYEPDGIGGITETTIFSVTDNGSIGGAALQNTGRVGFVCSADSQLGLTSPPLTASVVPVVTGFRVDVGGSLVLMDLFQRVYDNGQTISHGSTAAHNFYTVGGFETRHADLTTGWSGDIGSAVHPSGIDTWMRNAALVPAGPYTKGVLNDPSSWHSAIASASTDPIVAGGYQMYYRLGDVNWSQHRQLSVYFASHKANFTAATAYSTTRRWVGHAFRGAGDNAKAGQAPPSTETWFPGEGYDVLLGCDEGGAFTGEIRVYRRNGTAFQNQATYTLLATASVTCAVDTEYDFAAEVWTLASSGGNKDGAVAIKAYFQAGGGAATPIVLVAEDVSGVSEVGGVILDGSTDRIIAGAQEGIRMYCPELANGPVTYVFDWVQLTLGGGDVVDPGENDEASVSFAGEDDNDSGQTFTLPYDGMVTVVREGEVNEVAYESGHKYVGLRYPDARTTYDITATMTEAEHDDLLTFYDDHEGIALSFTFADPFTDETFKAIFIEDSLESQLVAPGVYQVGFRIRRLLP